MNLIAWMIIVCEVGFWILIIGGLAARYIFNQSGIGLVLFALTPVIDLLLVFVTSIDLYRGTIPNYAHGLAPIYIAITIVYGRSMIVWADERFLYYIKRNGSKPVRRVGIDYAKHSLKGSLQHVLAFIIGGAMLYGMILYLGEHTNISALQEILKIWGMIVLIDNAISITYFIWPRKK